MVTKNTNLKLWGMPVFLAVVTMAGLILAIMGTGTWHYFSWIALFIPVYIMWRHGIKFLKKKV